MFIVAQLYYDLSGCCSVEIDQRFSISTDYGGRCRLWRAGLDARIGFDPAGVHDLALLRGVKD
jgi:hypothetical protein